MVSIVFAHVLIVAGCAARHPTDVGLTIHATVASCPRISAVVGLSITVGIVITPPNKGSYNQKKEKDTKYDQQRNPKRTILMITAAAVVSTIVIITAV